MQRSEKRKRWLTDGIGLTILILSLSFNGALFFLLWFLAFPELSLSNLERVFIPKVQVELFAPDDPLLNSYRELSLQELLALLDFSDELRPGLKKRDLALTIAVGDHYFDLERALNHSPLFSKPLVQNSSFLYYPLKEEEFQKILHFVKTERLPVTLQGLFALAKGENRKWVEEALAERPEVHLVQTLLSRGGHGIDRKVVVNLVLEGSFELLNSFYKKQKSELSLEDMDRQEFLLSYVDQGSVFAAYILLATDFAFAKEKLDEKKLLLLLSLLQEKTRSRELFARGLLVSNHSEEVLQMAKKLIGGEEEKEVTKRFFERPGIGNLRPNFREPVDKSPPPSIHIVQKGETLWQIARRYKRTPEDLMQANKLSSSTLRVGQSLKIFP